MSCGICQIPEGRGEPSNGFGLRAERRPSVASVHARPRAVTYGGAPNARIGAPAESGCQNAVGVRPGPYGGCAFSHRVCHIPERRRDENRSRCPLSDRYAVAAGNLDSRPMAIALTPLVKESCPKAVELCATAEAFNPNAIELSPLAAAPLPKADAPNPVARA